MSPKFTLLLSLLCLTAATLSAQASCFTKTANYSGRTDLFDPAPVNAVSCDLVDVVDSLGANQDFRVMGVDLYPLAHFQNSDDGFRYAYDGHLQSIDAQSGGYLAESLLGL